MTVRFFEATPRTPAMCTATLLPIFSGPTGLRLVTSRDEKHARAAALPPRQNRFGPRAALLPIDPIGGGTWVAVNDAGVVVTLLNLNPEGARPVPADPISRGGVIPALMHHATAAAAAAQAGRFDAHAMLPFRLLIADDRSVAVVSADGRSIRVTPQAVRSDPLMLTSSGLGDRVVEGPRRALFEADAPCTATAQDRFHRHRWADRPQVSVAMHRADARTVSRTVVEVLPEAVTMTYTRVALDGTEGPAVTASLPRDAGASA